MPNTSGCKSRRNKLGLSERIGDWWIRRWAYADDLSKGGEQAQASKESTNLGAALSRALEDANCEALQRRVATTGKGGNASGPSKDERRRRDVQCNQSV